jgi:hypothetical protein
MANRCPEGFQLNPGASGQCVIQCPVDKGFSFKLVDGVPNCVHDRQTELKIQLNPLPSLPIPLDQPMPSIERIRSPGETVGPFKAEYDRFQKEFPVVEAKIKKTTALEDAFKELQDAENSRDKSPQAYQDARMKYYTLLNGEEWVNEEKQRIAKAEVDPVAAKFKTEFENKSLLVEQQGKTIDVVNGLKDRVLSIRDELGYSVNAFRKQIDELRSQILIERKKGEMKERTAFDWLNLILNVLLVIGLLFAAFTIFRKFQQYRLRTNTIINAPTM